METTSNLQLPYIIPSQAPKHLSHNEAIRRLEAIVQLTVIGSFSKLGINADGDTTNRLSLFAPATSLNHEGNDHRLKVNKASGAYTAFVLFQSGFSGRAEFRLTGSDDFTVKVSDDGQNWNNAISVDAANGKVELPNTQPVLHGRPDDVDAIDNLNIDAELGDDNKDGTTAANAIKTMSALGKLLTFDRRLTINILSDMTVDHMISMSLPVTDMTLHGRNRANYAYQKIHAHHS